MAKSMMTEQLKAMSNLARLCVCRSHLSKPKVIFLTIECATKRALQYPNTHAYRCQYSGFWHTTTQMEEK